MFYICFIKISEIFANKLIYSRLSENPYEWHSKGQEFDSPMLHKKVADSAAFFCFRGLGGVYLDLDSPWDNGLGLPGLRFYDEVMLNLLYKNADLAAGKWKLVKGYMTSC